MIKKESSFLTFTAGKVPDSVAVEVSDLDNELFKSSLLVSTPVFFVFGEANIWDVPSPKAEVVLILSEKFEIPRFIDGSLGESRLTAPLVPFVPSEKETDLEKCSGGPNEVS